MASAGTSIRVIRSGGSSAIAGESSSTPGRVQPTKWASSNSFSHVPPGQDLGQRVGAGDEEQVDVLAALAAQIPQRVDRVRQVPGRSMSTRLTLNRGFEAVAITVIR